MPNQLELLSDVSREAWVESEDFLTKQLITYIGNKRGLLEFIGGGLSRVQQRLGKEKLDVFDVFSGSGVVSRFLKQYSRMLYTNDLERYATLINECYLTNREDFKHHEFDALYTEINLRLRTEPLRSGFIADMYAPVDDARIRIGERAFYTRRNACYIDTACQLINEVPERFRPFLKAPLLSEASVHANTSGVFKGFHKNRDNGAGQFGGRNRDAQFRILGDIELPYPVFSSFSCGYRIFNGDSNLVCEEVPDVDVAYLDPPYNQHPYGSNYFMLNAIADYVKPEAVSEVSGIPTNWKRSRYNRRRDALAALAELAGKLKAKFLLISFNSEGFISLAEMTNLCESLGRLTVLETKYNTFRGSRNLINRAIHVKEYLYLLEKN